MLVAIPMRDWSCGVLELIGFWRRAHKEGIAADIVVFNDQSLPEHIGPVRETGVQVVDVPRGRERGLRWAYMEAARMADARGLPLVMTCESDMEPLLGTVRALQRALGRYPQIACASARYVHPVTLEQCYPSRGSYDVHFCDDELGRVRWQKALPFAFCLWRTVALQEIDERLPDFYLDGPLGRKLSKGGWKMLELLDHVTGHTGGGQQSPRGPR